MLQDIESVGILWEFCVVINNFYLILVIYCLLLILLIFHRFYILFTFLDFSKQQKDSSSPTTEAIKNSIFRLGDQSKDVKKGPKKHENSLFEEILPPVKFKMGQSLLIGNPLFFILRQKAL